MEVPAQSKSPPIVLRRDVRGQRWGDASSRSGSGSSLEVTETLRAELPAFWDRLGVRSLLDVPCGDWVWMQHVDLSRIDRYIGGDVVPALVEEVRSAHGGPGRSFIEIDALTSDLPRVDAVMVRDLFGHLDHAQSRRLVRNVKRSGATW
ncbi:MAG: class I SAM-dependent methyltransferase, partial [Solirubrobacterales bacterium]|nr:class I SAM-dependent methyltransferase [Solirubrobacterales bacterium]